MRFTTYEQKIHSPVNGDCLRAALATMMQWNPDELPNFVEDDDPWLLVTLTGLERGWYLSHQTRAYGPTMNQSPTGWMMATVKSIAFPSENHSLVVDAGLNLVHDPNPPKWKRSSIEPSDILTVFVAVPVSGGDAR